MGIIQYIKQIRKTESNQKAIAILSIIEKWIENKYILVDSKHYQVAMHDIAWDLFNDTAKVNFCASVKFYCDIQNAYYGNKVYKKANLLISLKYENDEVIPFAYFDGKNVIKYEVNS